MNEINSQLQELELKAGLLKIPDLSLLSTAEGHALAARVMNLSGRLNQLSYQILFATERQQAAVNGAAAVAQS
ncbi:hypothetical protein KP001_09035 [Geomonas subterranea]|uniref:Uncharacterized protein n=1 Tax=Geomonas subterranea TaxID=2847989 RepID=A0ABX8LLT2_9BACT|nr:hypothetical protein [Geomonas subterranea]QXE92642.1 hypothetical protein KP001_09035 [Geomonas subterranea]QXM09259.1 hypothetical protein KP002_20240 [Geomonas subterranea]